MGYLNQTATGPRPKHDHLNFMGGPAYNVNDPFLKLQIAAASCFFGEPMYYHREGEESSRQLSKSKFVLSTQEMNHLRTTLGAITPAWHSLSPAALIEKAIDEALDVDVERTLQVAVYLRDDAHIRVTPQVILVRAAHHPKVQGTNLIRQYARTIIARADEPAVGLAYHLAKYGKKIPTRLKRAWKDALERFDEYQLAKYRTEGREVKLVDVMNLVHPKGEAIDKLARGTLTTTGQTWESIVSRIGSNLEGWTAALGVMGHMALLRNIRNLLQAGVPPADFTDKLIKGAEHGKQLPFRYVSAYYANRDAPPQVVDAIEQSLKASLGNLPEFKGKVMSLCDNSGSAQSTTTSSMGSMKISTIGNLTGVLTAMRADEGYVGAFGDVLRVVPIRKTASVFDQLDKVEQSARGVGQATEGGIWLFWEKAIENREHWDHVFIYSDMQAGHGHLYGPNPRSYAKYSWPWRPTHIDVPRLVTEYRSKVNPRVNVYLVQIAGYQDTIIPECFDRTYILGGWGDGLLRFAAAMNSLADARVTQ